MDEHNGVLTCTASVSVLASVVLLVLSEAALFVSFLWTVVLQLVAHSAYIPSHALEDAWTPGRLTPNAHPSIGHEMGSMEGFIGFFGSS